VDVLVDMVGRDLVPEKRILVEAANACAESRDGVAAERLFELVKTSSLPMTRYAYDRLLKAMASGGRVMRAWTMYEYMLAKNVSPGPHTYAILLTVCADAGLLERCRELHVRLRQDSSVARDVVLMSALINMYAKCGRVAEAETVFKDARREGVSL